MTKTKEMVLIVERLDGKEVKRQTLVRTITKTKKGESARYGTVERDIVREDGKPVLYFDMRTLPASKPAWLKKPEKTPAPVEPDPYLAGILASIPK